MKAGDPLEVVEAGSVATGGIFSDAADMARDFVGAKTSDDYNEKMLEDALKKFEKSPTWDSFYGIALAASLRFPRLHSALETRRSLALLRDGDDLPPDASLEYNLFRAAEASKASKPLTFSALGGLMNILVPQDVLKERVVPGAKSLFGSKSNA